MYFFPPGFISVVNTSVFVGSVYSLRKCARRVTYGYSIDDVTAWSWVNLATPIHDVVGVNNVPPDFIH